MLGRGELLRVDGQHVTANLLNKKLSSRLLPQKRVKRRQAADTPAVQGSADAAFVGKIILSGLVYAVSVSAVPIYNKKVFSGDLGITKFPFPNFVSSMQMLCVSLILISWHLGSRAVRKMCGRQDDGTSWLFGPHFGYKLRNLAPVGLLFGIKYAITNWGLQLVPIATHLLLQSTNLICTATLARFVNKEYLGFLEHLGVALTSIGSLIVCLHVSQSMSAPVIPLLINLLTPLALAGCTTLLRKSAKELADPNNCIGGSMTLAEFTGIKMFLSAVTAFSMAMLLENGVVQVAGKSHGAWWTALAAYSPLGIFLMASGCVFILVFQVNITWLSRLTSATTVGIIGQLKVVPQTLLSMLFQINESLNPLAILFTLLGCTVYCLGASSKEKLQLTCSGFEWESRSQKPRDGDLKEPLVKKVDAKQRGLDKTSSHWPLQVARQPVAGQV